MSKSRKTERFVAFFRTRSSNRSIFDGRWQQVNDLLTQVEQILEQRGQGLLIQDCLKVQEDEHLRLHGLLSDLVVKSRQHPADALVEILDLYAPAKKLLADTLIAREELEGKERSRRNLQSALSQLLLAITEGLKVVAKVAGARPDAAHLRLTGITDLEDDKVQEKIDLAEPLAGDVILLSSLAEELAGMKLPTTLPTERQKAVDDAVKLVKQHLVDAKPAETLDAVEQLRAAIAGGVRVQEAQQTIKGLDPTQAYVRYTIRIKDILEYPAEYASQAVRDLQIKVREADQAYQEKAKFFVAAQEELASSTTTNELVKQMLGKKLEIFRGTAQKALDVLVKQLDDATAPMQKHDLAMRGYYDQLKKLRPRMRCCEALPLQVATVDTAWKSEREAYDVGRLAVKTAADKHDYATASAKLKDLVGLINALIKKRVDALDTDITTATGVGGSGTKAATLVDELSMTPGLLAELKPKQSLDLLKTLREKPAWCPTCNVGYTYQEYKDNSRECPDCSDPLNLSTQCSKCKKPGKPSVSSPCACSGTGWNVGKRMEQRGKIFANIQLDPAFVEHDKTKRKEVIEALREDDQFAEAETQWATWSKSDLVKAEAFLSHVVEIQCKALGHDQTGLSRDFGDGNGVVNFPGVPVKVKFFTPNPAKPGLYGQCKPGFPTYIEINTTCRLFGDFKEMVDTVVHENAHAFQEMLIKAMKQEAPFTDGTKKGEIENNPALKTQAELFRENDETYFQSSTLDYDGSLKATSRSAYRHEPLEEHAWTTGGSISKALLVPPQVVSFESKRGRKNKIWRVASLTRANQPQIRLTERHGIYVDEWEGEKAADKKLILENIKLAGKLKAVDVRIIKVTDEYTLQLNVDLSGYDDDPNNNGKLVVETARLILDETVTDI